MCPIQQAGTVRNTGNLRNFASVDLPMHQGWDVSFLQLRTCLPDWLRQLCANNRHMQRSKEHRLLDHVVGKCQ